MRRFALALISNQACLGSKLTNPFNFQKLGLNEVTLYPNGYPIAGTPLSTDDEKRVYLTTRMLLLLVITEMVFLLLITKIILCLFFDLTSTQQQAPHDFLNPELTNAAVSLELKFSAALPADTEVFLGRKSFNNLY